MFIIRTAFWLTVVAILLPLGTPDEGQREVSYEQGAEMTTGAALSAAYSTVEDVAGFCDRNPLVCETGGAALVAVREHARQAVRVVFEWAQENSGPVRTDVLGREAQLITGSITVANGTAPSQNTLRIDDIIPEWSGPEARSRA